MAKKATADIKTEPRERAAASSMLHATNRANSRMQTNAFYFGGSLGDSIERRLNTMHPNGFLGGGGGHIGEGAHGLSSTWLGQGYGMQYGLGQGFGPGSRFGPHVGGLGGGGFTYLRRFSGNAAFNHQIIAACIIAYLSSGVVRRVLDLYADFASEGLEIVHPDQSVRNFYNAWMQKVGLKNRVHNMFLTYFVTGNVGIYRRWAKLSASDIRQLKRFDTKVIAGDLYVEKKNEDVKIDPHVDYGDSVIASNAIAFGGDSVRMSDSSVKADVVEPDDVEVETKDNMIPWGYTALNPLQLEIRGKKFRGEHHWVMLLDKGDARDLAQQYGFRRGNDVGVTRIDLPKSFEGRLTETESTNPSVAAEVRLDDDDFFMLHDRKFDWFEWAVPFVFPALEPLDFKNCLRKMERKACESVLNSVFLFKLGNKEKGLYPEEEHVERLADMLQMPGSVMNLIWDFEIEAEVLESDVSKLFDPKKHESADRDILMALGVPEVLLGGKGGNFASAFVAIASVLERLESAREALSEWIMHELRLIADVMGFRKLPSIKWGNSKLRDENAAKQMMINLYDRGLASKDVLLREFDTTFEQELAKQREEYSQIQESDDPNVMPDRGPFIKEGTIRDKTADLEFEKEHVDEKAEIQEKMTPKPAPGEEGPPGAKPKAKDTPKTGNGRPGGSKEGKRGKQDNPRAPKGQNTVGMIEMYEDIKASGEHMLRSLESRIQSRYLKAAGLDLMKQAQKEDKVRLEKMVYNVFSHMPTHEPSNFDHEDYLLNVLQSDAAVKIKADVLTLYQKKVAKYSSRFGKEPSREHRRQFMISAWTTCAMGQIGVRSSDAVVG